MNAVKFLIELDEFYNNKIKKNKETDYEVPYTTMNVGIIKGGSGINSVSESCEVSIDFRIANKNHINYIQKKIDSLSIKYECKVNKIKTPLNPPTGVAGINRGFPSKKEDENFSSSGNMEKAAPSIPDAPPCFNDGKQRNYNGLLEFFRQYGIAPAIQMQVILLSNYGEIGNPVWKLIAEIRSNPKIKMPQQFLISRLRIQ